MIENAPALAGLLPKSGAAAEALDLPQSVSEQVNVGTQAAKAVIVAVPARGSRVDRRALFENTEDDVSTVAPARCANFPVIGRHKSFKVDDRRAEGCCVKDRLAAAKFFRNREQRWVYVSEDHVIRHTAIVWLDKSEGA